MTRVISVESVKIQWVGMPTSYPVITSFGTVNSLGWSRPSLEPFKYIAPPEDGVQDFDFVAVPPDGPVGDAMMPILAHRLIGMPVDNYWGSGRPLKGVRIHAATNAVETPIGDVARLVRSGDDDPYPLAQALAAMGDDNIFPRGFDLLPDANVEDLRKQLIGRKVRAYHTGDVLTMDHMPERVNIELNRNTYRVVSVWMG